MPCLSVWAGPQLSIYGGGRRSGGIGGRDATCVVWACDDGYHAVCCAEAPGCADEYATNDADAAVEQM
jgi:hypothetical protein